MDRLMVAIPSTLTSVEKNRTLRTYIIGALARFFGMYRVTHVFVYHDKDPYFDSHALGKYIVKTLKYAVTPPWLKKHAFPLEETDPNWGVIPPLQIRSHNRPGDWGVVLRGGYLTVDGKKRSRISAENLRKAGYSVKLPQLVIVKDGKIVDPYRIDRKKYVGFWPRYVNKPLGEVVKYVKKRFNAAVIGTDRDGAYIGEIARRLKSHGNRDVLITFGSHHRGILEMDDFNVDDYDEIVSLFARQETKSVRTEEAIPLTLEALHTIGLYGV